MSFYINKKYSLFISMFFVFLFVFVLSIGFYYENAFRNKIINVELPLLSHEIIYEIDNNLFEVGRGLDVIARGPILQTWIANGEPNRDIDQVYYLLENIINTYKIDTANFASRKTKQYTLLRRDSSTLDFSHTFDDKTDWYVDFQERTAKGDFNSTFVVYVNDPDWETQSYINKRVEYNDEFVGMITVSTDTLNLSTQLLDYAVGEEGNTFFINSKGDICLHKDMTLIHKHVLDVYPEYKSFFSEILNKHNSYNSYTLESESVFDTHHVFSEKMNFFDLIVVVESSENEFMTNYKIDDIVYVFAVLLACLALYFYYRYKKI